MFDFNLSIYLILNAFSFKKGSLRYPTVKRLFNVLVTFPLFLVLTLINRFFMMLDHIIFPTFRKMKVNNMVFITGVPRSATTYLYHLLAEDKGNFTCFKLWEILLAPSIIQKYIFSWILKIDRLTGRPLYRASLFYDRKFLSPIARLHEISLSKPEEDEMLLLYAFASVYLVYFFPEVNAMDPYLFFDEQISNNKKHKIMLFYKQCIQRHVYFYDRNETKCFLSKNPGFISKTASLAETFENTRLIYMLRSPLKTIPSTISLNKNIYSIISGAVITKPMVAKTRDTIIKWYQMVDNSIACHWQYNSITIPFRRITRNPATTVSEIYNFLKLAPSPRINQIKEIELQKKLPHITTYEYNSIDDEDDLKRQLDFIFSGRYRDDL